MELRRNNGNSLANAEPQLLSCNVWQDPPNYLIALAHRAAFPELV